MHDAAKVRDFLTTRRARLTPLEAGLPFAGGQRRVPGLRREEVAMLAGMSVDYSTRLERGNLAGASDAVLDALARALRLDEAEREHLHDLARLANASQTARLRAPRSARGVRAACPGPGVAAPGAGPGVSRTTEIGSGRARAAAETSCCLSVWA